VERDVSRNESPITLVLFPGALGDCICLLPALHALCARGLRAPLVLIAPAAILPLLVRSGLADEGLPIESARVARVFVDGADLRDLVDGRRVGDVYTWLGSGDPVVRGNLSRLARGAVRGARVTPPQEHVGHVAHHFLATVGASTTLTPGQARVTIAATEHAVARRFWRERGLDGHPVLALHRGAGSAAKRWADDGFRAVARSWGGKGGKIIEVIGPADHYDPLERADALVRDRPVVEVGALLAGADVVLGGDSGIMHLAGAVGCRGVVLFGPTAPRRWRPLGGRMVCLKSRTSCVDAGPIPLAGISADRVMRALCCVAWSADDRRPALARREAADSPTRLP
jgi:ADP-heptose:LPS heptosyltransferase